MCCNSQLALTAAPPSSEIFVFTDAPAKDTALKSTVTALIESTKSVVSSFHYCLSFSLCLLLFLSLSLCFSSSLSLSLPLLETVYCLWAHKLSDWDLIKCDVSHHDWSQHILLLYCHSFLTFTFLSSFILSSTSNSLLLSLPLLCSLSSPLLRWPSCWLTTSDPVDVVVGVPWAGLQPYGPVRVEPPTGWPNQTLSCTVTLPRPLEVNQSFNWFNSQSSCPKSVLQLLIEFSEHPVLPSSRSGHWGHQGGSAPGHQRHRGRLRCSTGMIMYWPTGYRPMSASSVFSQSLSLTGQDIQLYT